MVRRKDGATRINFVRMKKVSWYLTSLEWIAEQRTKNPGMTREELKKHCSKHYPWAERRGRAYKSFLKAMQKYFGKNYQHINNKQLDLFAQVKL